MAKRRRRRSSGRFAGTAAEHAAQADNEKRMAVIEARSFYRNLRAGNCKYAYHTLLALVQVQGMHGAERRWTGSHTARRTIARLASSAQAAFARRCVK